MEYGSDGTRPREPARAESIGCGNFYLLLALPFPPPRSSVASRKKANFTISYTQASGAFTPLWVAQETGIFKKHGLHTTLKLLNSQVAAQALIAGEVDVISVGPEFVNARPQGGAVKCIGGTSTIHFSTVGSKGNQYSCRPQGQDRRRHDSPVLD